MTAKQILDFADLWLLNDSKEFTETTDVPTLMQLRHFMLSVSQMADDIVTSDLVSDGWKF